MTIELVPKTSWGSNLRNSMSKKNWDIVRNETYKKYDNKCGICGAAGTIQCHEIWEYDDANHIQNLRGFIALCPSCHNIKHIGRAGILATEGKLDFNELIRHFIKINRCSQDIFEKHFNEAFDVWKERSKHEWIVNVGDYRDIVKNKSKT